MASCRPKSWQMAQDRMSMSASREVRFPFLDVRLLDRLLAMPAAFKLRSGWTKHVLRLAVQDWLPPEIVWRRDKQGFINPESEWLKRELRPRVEEARKRMKQLRKVKK